MLKKNRQVTVMQFIKNKSFFKKKSAFSLQEGKKNAFKGFLSLFFPFTLLLFSCNSSYKPQVPDVELKKREPAFVNKNEITEVEVFLDNINVRRILLTDTAAWLTTERNGAMRYQNGKRYWVDIEHKEVNTQGYDLIKRGKNGSLWLSNSYDAYKYPILFFDGKKWQAARHTRSSNYFSLNDDGSFWALLSSSERTLIKWKDQQIDTLEVPFKIYGISNIHSTSSDLWFTGWQYKKTIFGAETMNTESMLFRYDGNEYYTYNRKNLFDEVSPYFSYGNQILSNENTVWISASDYIVSLKNGEWSYINMYEVSSHYDSFSQLTTDPDGNLWGVASSAIYKFQEDTVTRYAARPLDLENSGSEYLSCIAFDKQGRIHIGTNERYYAIKFKEKRPGH